MEKAEDIITFENVSEGVERNGIEPLTSTMPLLRSTNWANAPQGNYKILGATLFSSKDAFLKSSSGVK